MKQRSIIDRISQNKADLKDSIPPYYRSKHRNYREIMIISDNQY